MWQRVFHEWTYRYGMLNAVQRRTIKGQDFLASWRAQHGLGSEQGRSVWLPPFDVFRCPLVIQAATGQ